MKTLFYIAFSVMLMACSGDKKPVKPSENQEVVKTLNFDKSAAKVNWTAYKFTERVGVSGTFKTLNLTGKLFGNTIETALKDTQFEIPVESVFSANPERDKKLVELFFGKMSATDAITGQINELTGDDKKGSCKVSISMNNVTKNCQLEYHQLGQKYVLKGLINLEDWKAQTAIASLNETCKELHKG
ncbi:MAG: YceI family protein, partial [Flavobacteriales bacterium]